MQVVVSRPVQHVSSDILWAKLSLFSDFSWHSEIKSSKDVGSIPDGSDNMVGATRDIVKVSGEEVTETVLEWSDKEKYQKFSLVKGVPPFAQSITISFKVKEADGNNKALLEVTADAELKSLFGCFAPLLSMVLKKKLGEFVEEIANYKE